MLACLIEIGIQNYFYKFVAEQNMIHVLESGSELSLHWGMQLSTPQLGQQNFYFIN